MIDQMKWSSEKIDLINASMDDNEIFLSYVFPLLRYHSRIDKLTSENLPLGIIDEINVNKIKKCQFS